ncbi:hypothetical protein OROMI_010095 [Orobanche minor]
MNHSRFLPPSTYRDPNYDSDTSFEEYYLNYAEEKVPAPPAKQVLITEKHDHDHEKEEIKTIKRIQIYDDDDGVHGHDRRKIISPPRNIRRRRSAIRRRKRTQSRIWNFINNTTSNNSYSPESTVTENTGSSTVRIDRDHDHRAVLFTRRVLQNSDMNRQQHRLSMPCKQVEIQPDELFTRDESKRLRNKSPVEAKLIDPRGEEYGIYLRLTMSGPSTYCYAIGKPWLRIKDENGFEPGMVLDVWVTRRGEMGELCFILQRVG